VVACWWILLAGEDPPYGGNQEDQGWDPEVMAGWEVPQTPQAFDDWCSYSQHQDISDISGHTTADHGTLFGFLMYMDRASSPEGCERTPGRGAHGQIGDRGGPSPAMFDECSR